MRKDFLPFSRPSITEEDISAVGEVLRSGWITTGPNTAAFERDFREYVGCNHAVALGSATAGMHLLLKALGVGPGDEVITPSMTWVSTVNLIVLAGATPVFADIDRDTLMVTPETVAPCFSSRTRAVIPVHYAGAAADIRKLRQQAQKHNVPMVEDAAHALGTHHGGHHVGSKGTSIFSFHPIKNITTGEGGMFCTDDNEMAERISRLKFHGLGVDAYDRETQGRSPQAEALEPGYKYNMTDMAAVLGLRQLHRLNQFNRKRSQLAARYREWLADIDELLPLAISDNTTQHAWHLFIVRLDTDRAGMSRDEFMERLKAKNIGTGLHFRAVHMQKYYRESMGMEKGALPNTEWNSDRICSLPLFPDMTFVDVDSVVEAIKEVLNH
ncbi:MAG: UDP-4-amino-4-deoxy-L-arabinose--oxoglutarate aminotransferase [Desulfobacteraceae bacterium 4572_87]|nr:MAG: UDP-4-amino-4-deoxy-L-arabinose--oxoglutarate aminotransferase [Desulfobacteraceae bacterium 4572_87]